MIISKKIFTLLLKLCYIIPSGQAFPLLDIMTEYSLEYQFPELPYGYDQLEPFIDRATLLVHHTGHHKTYTSKLNAALAEWRNETCNTADGPAICKKSIISILRDINHIPAKHRQAIINNGGGFVNHNLYWSGMSPSSGLRYPSGSLAEDINRDFGSYLVFKDAFTQQALNLFGSGYVWLSRQPKDLRLVISTTANQDSPVSQGLHPILVLDVWEHAYYLKHQNKRPSHIADWWMIVDWQAVTMIDNWWKEQYEHDEL